jgi:hypothetical protein
MRTRTILPFAALLFAPLAQASVMGSAYGFTYGNDRNQFGESYLYIDGPQGRDIFDFGFSVDIWGTPLINRFGQLVSRGEATDDPYIYFAVYGQGGFTGRFAGGNGLGYLGGVPGDVSFGSLGWAPGYIDGIEEDGMGWGKPLSIDDNGLVTGLVRRYFHGGPGVTTELVTWQLADLKTEVTGTRFRASLDAPASAVPEPGSAIPLLLAATAALCVRRRRPSLF